MTAARIDTDTDTDIDTDTGMGIGIGTGINAGTRTGIGLGAGISAGTGPRVSSNGAARPSPAADRFHTRIRHGRLQLDLRRSVAFRELSLRDGVAWYLSLLDREIEARFDRYLASVAAPRHGGLVDCAAVCGIAHDLELTDALITCTCDGTVTVLRGGSCTLPLFWSGGACGGVRLSTALPLLEEPISQRGLVAAAAVVWLHSSYEPNAFAETPVAGWRRLRRAAATTFRPRAPVTERAILQVSEGPHAPSPTENAMAARIRDAFAEYGRSQRSVTSSVLELSGGFDSTLAAAAALTPRHRMLGVSAHFPYYEFRFEEGVQQAVAAALGVPRSVLDGTHLFPYTPAQVPARFEEPAVFVTGIRHAECVGLFAAQHRVEQIYMGHGGDQLFCTDLESLEPTLATPPKRGPFSRRAWREVGRAMGKIAQSTWRVRSAGTFVYDARQDVWAKETFGATLRTPFTDLAVFRTAQQWSRWCRARETRPDKTILQRALPELLPEAVTRRKGKVAYDGVWMRAYADQAEHLSATFDRCGEVLEHIGLSPAWLLRRTRDLASWKPVSDREILAAYAVASWLTAWGIERIADVPWGDDFTRG